MKTPTFKRLGLDYKMVPCVRGVELNCGPRKVHTGDYEVIFMNKLVGTVYRRRTSKVTYGLRDLPEPVFISKYSAAEYAIIAYIAEAFIKKVQGINILEEATS